MYSMFELFSMTLKLMHLNKIVLQRMTFNSKHLWPFLIISVLYLDKLLGMNRVLITLIETFDVQLTKTQFTRKTNHLISSFTCVLITSVSPLTNFSVYNTAFRSLTGKLLLHVCEPPVTDIITYINFED